MIIDPIASLRCWEIEVEIGGQEYTIPALPAADWWAALLDDRHEAAILGLIRDDSGLDDLLLAGADAG